MRCAVYQPVFGHHGAIGRAVHTARAGPASRGFQLFDLDPRRAAGAGRDYLRAVARVHRGVGVAVKNDGGHPACAGTYRAGTALHRPQGRRQVGGDAGGQPGVHADGCEQVRVGVTQDGGHGAACGQAGNINAVGVNRIGGHDLAGHARQQRRLAAPTHLVAVFEPVPAALRVGPLRLRRIQHIKALRAGHGIHLRTRSKVVRVLGAAVQHHHQRQGAFASARRNVEFEVALPARTAMAAGDEAPRPGRLIGEGR